MNSESDDVPELLQNLYAAPELDETFSADLIQQLQAEVPSISRTRGTSATLGVSLISGVTLMIAIVVISQVETPQQEALREDGSVSSYSRFLSDDSLTTLESLQAADPYSRNVEELRRGQFNRRLSLAEGQREAARVTRFDLLTRESEHESLSKQPPNKTLELESRVLHEHLREQLLQESKVPDQLSILQREKRWLNTAMTSAAGKLYLIQNELLYEVTPVDGSLRLVGKERWSQAETMTAAEGYLYIVAAKQLYEVQPATGVRRKLGTTQWSNGVLLSAAEKQLYIVAGGVLYRVSRTDGSHEVVPVKAHRPNPPVKSQQ